MSVVKLQRRLGELEHQSKQRSRRFDRHRYASLDCFSDAELEELVVLAEKREHAQASGVAVVWTDEELASLERLGQVEQRCRSSS